MKIKIEKIVYPGKALGRGEDGIATFVEGALPGETAEVLVVKDKKTYKEAKLERVIETAAGRVVPLCPSYGHCGGCSFQHTGYDNQVAIKETYVRELLGKYCGDIAACVKSPSEWRYRNKMEFSFFRRAGSELDLGLHEKNEFDRYFSVPPCFICGEDFLDLIKIIKNFARGSGMAVYDKRSKDGFFRHLVLRKGERTGEMLVNLVVSGLKFPEGLFAPLINALNGKAASLFVTVNTSVSDAVKADELIPLYGKECIEESMLVKGRRYSFSVSPFSFFQTNTAGAEKLYETVIDLANFGKDESVLDLYCGTGTIGIVISPFVKKVLGVEQVEQAVQNAEVNKERNRAENVSFESGALEKWVKGMVPTDFGTIVVDPPRGGLSGKVIDFVLKCSPEKVVYVSCNPATLARDLQEFEKKGGYRAARAVPVDMFPQTFHIETAALLRRS